MTFVHADPVQACFVQRPQRMGHPVVLLHESGGDSLSSCDDVVPCVEGSLDSFVHSYLQDQGMLGDFVDNRPLAVRCVHPLVTLLEKLDAMARRYARDPVDADAFVRHYEDAAQIARAAAGLPDAGMTPLELAEDMLAQKDISTMPSPDEPALHLADAHKRAAVERAYDEIEPMFWGPRIPLDESCKIIRNWLTESIEDLSAPAATVHP